VVEILVSGSLKKYKAFVFDFDGVIVESNKIKKTLFFEIWDEYRDDEIINNVLSAGGTRYEIIESLYYKLIPQYFQKEKTVKEYITEYTKKSEVLISSLKINQEIYQLLVKEYKNKLFFINSATPTKTLQVICHNLNISHYFKAILGVEDNKKQNFYNISHKYNISLDEMLFFGDMVSDQDVAVALRIDFIPVYSIGSDLLTN
jgi:phosphoglycolate phosphatase-like HAD superfamily hydrolase